LIGSLARRSLVALAVLALAACGTGQATGEPTPTGAPSPTPGGASPSASGSPGSTTSAPSGSATKLVVGMGYIPSVQFAQFYLAQQNGYYHDAGLDVEFQYATDVDVITLVGQGAVDVGIADGTSVIPAVSQGIPLKYVATIYGTFPNVVFAKAGTGINMAADLRGKKIGIPGRFGSSWIMLQALLQSAGLSTSDVTVKEYPGFGQGVAVQQGLVDAATGFANNEPVQLAYGGVPASVIHVDPVVPLPGQGLIVADKVLAQKHDALKAFVAATLRAMQEVSADPGAGFRATAAARPELANDANQQLAVLRATIEIWQSPYTQVHGLGAIDRDAWARSITFMSSLPDHPVAGQVTVDQVVDEGLLGG
jgi:NitT/TauT family transport system substrate-binding protein